MKKTFVRFMAIILAIAMIAGSGFYLVYLFGDAGFAVYASSEEEAYRKLDRLKDVIQAINENYKEDISVESLVDAAYDGVFKSLDDWSVYFPSSEEEQSFVSALSNEEYSGIGVTIQKDDRNECLIIETNFKGPARRAGVKAGDVLTHIDGKDIAKWTLNDIQNALRGVEGTAVALAVRRADSSLSFSIVREKLSATTVNSEMLEGGVIAYINISGFNLGTAEDFGESVLELLGDGAKALIIDVRDNGGGYLDEAMNSAAGLVKQGTTLMYYYKGDAEIDEIYTASSSVEDKLCDIVVLVNENTASAAEAFAAALKDNKAAVLVGTNTYGKGVAQQIFEGNGDDYFKISTMYFRGPGRESIDGQGVKPNYIVYNNAGLDAEKVAALSMEIIPMNEGKKYNSLGNYGLNVLAAQQRLELLGYGIKPTGIFDEPTMKALKELQHQAGVFSYGGLDFTTIKILEERFSAYLFGESDAQLAKAVELLR